MSVPEGIDMTPAARALWLVAPGRAEIRPAELSGPGPGEILVRTLYSAVSRGTEALVFRGGVPPSQYAAMRAPFQEGEFPGPVKYGYLNVGRVEAGAEHLRGRTVFCLYPHQTAYVVPAAAALPVPDEVPAARAVLAGTVETAVNALWDASPLVGDRIAVVGAGMVGCCVARVAAGIPGARVVLYDVDDSRAEMAGGLGVEFGSVPAAGRAGTFDVVLHASGSGDGLQLALDLVADEGRVVELSWYGDRPVTVHLGGRFHSARLGIVASQVGRIPPARRGRRTLRDRLGLALELLADPAFDALLSPPEPFADLPVLLPRLAAAPTGPVCTVIGYRQEGPDPCSP